MVMESQWRQGNLGDVIDSLVAGVSVNSGKNDGFCNYYVLKTSAISKGQLNLSEKKPVLPREVARLKCCLTENTILISRMNTPELVGECAYVAYGNSQIFLPDRIWQTNFRKDVYICAKWLNYLLSSSKYRSLIKNCATGTSNSMKNISKDQLLDLEIIYPPIEEQTAIAEALSDVDSLISSLKKLIEKKRAIKQGAMQELLTGKKRLPGFSEKWKSKSLGSLGELLREVVNPQDFSEDLFYEYSMPAYDDGKHPIKVRGASMHSSRLKISGEVLLFNKLNVRQKRVWFVGKCKENSVCSSEFLPYHSLNILPTYLYQLLISDRITADFEGMSTGTSNSQKRITPTDFLDYRIFIPDIKEQQAISQILSDMDREIEQLEKKLAKYQQIKQGMMQELLTGRIRLVDVEGNEQPKTQAVQEKQPQLTHNQYFDDAVMIAGIVNAFYSEKYRLGRKKVQKLLYLVRRKEQADTSAFHKKAAGPYADVVRYKGGEPIAQKNHYIQVKTSDKGSCFAKGEKMEQALAYLQDWGKQADIDWLVSQFQYTNVDELELLATVDMAMCDLWQEGIEVSVSAIKDLIRSNKEWRDKLKKTYFKDADIQWAIKRCRELFPDKEG